MLRMVLIFLIPWDLTAAHAISVMRKKAAEGKSFPPAASLCESQQQASPWRRGGVTGTGEFCCGGSFRGSLEAST